jgi:hypothetical protein
MTSTILAPFSQIQKLASIAIFAEQKASPYPWMNGVTVAVQTERITGIATDRYVIGSYEMGIGGLDQGLETDYLSLSLATCKAISAVKLPKRGISTCTITYGNGVFTIEHDGIVYKGESLPDLEKRFDQMLTFIQDSTEETFSGFALVPSHLAKLSKVSKDHWRFDRLTDNNKKLAPVRATTGNFTVVIQPIIERS